MIDFYALSVILFVILLVAVLYKDRKNLERNSILLIRRTNKGSRTIRKIALRCPRFWKWVGNAGIIIGFVVSVYILYFMVQSLIRTILVEGAGPTLSLVVPSISSTTSMGPGYLAVPFWYWIISIGLLVLVHEGFHGIMTIVGRTKIKSLGWGVLAILPLAFVEPDEDSLKKKSLIIRLRVYAAGSLANFIFAGIYFALFAIVSASLFVPAGVAYRGTIDGYPAYNANMTGAIISIDGHAITDSQDLTNVLEMIGENKTITIITKNSEGNSTYILRTMPPPDVPEFRENWMTNFMIGLETNFPGTIDMLNSLSRLFGNEGVESWAALNYEKEFWEYAKQSNPAISKEAEARIDEIERKLVNRHRPGFIGIAGVTTFNELKEEYSQAEPFIGFMQGLLLFLFILNSGVGLANLLPIIPLDGGKMWEDLFHEYLPKRKAELLIKLLSWFTFLIIIAGFAIPFLKSLL
ncbi:MAG: hypothetical protein GXO64_04640 [Candidatus Micrarchaeota archaeon]|nr:hypothetical protein [Candidatus Micrarchaeota archaeon]